MTIMPAGAPLLPYRSNIPEISQFVLEAIDRKYPSRAAKTRLIRTRDRGGRAIMARDQAASTPRLLLDIWGCAW